MLKLAFSGKVLSYLVVKCDMIGDSNKHLNVACFVKQCKLKFNTKQVTYIGIGHVF